MRQRLTIRSHTEACIIANAIREHCRRESDKWQGALIEALRIGDKARAAECMRHRDEYSQCQMYYAEYPYGKLQEIMKRFEDQMEEINEPESSGGSGGYSLDNATCFN